MNTLLSQSYRTRPSFFPKPFQTTLPPLYHTPRILHLPLQTPPCFLLQSTKTQHTNPYTDQNQPPLDEEEEDDDDGIASEDVKILAKFKSRYNYIRVLEVSRRADHALAGSRLLLLDSPGNIHSISFLFKSLTSTYFDVFATFPPILPPGPVAILGFGAGSAARLILHLYPDAEIHGWELDPSVISVAREYFGLSKLEKQNPDKLLIHIGDALQAESRDGFSGILVDLFAKGSVIPELQEKTTWEELKRRLRKGGRIMVNCGGSCVEAEDPRRDGDLVMEETVKAMREVFADQVFVLNLGQRKEDSCVALTGPLPDLDAWKQSLPSALRCYVDKWKRYSL
ncbi:uncharacterized protein [Typha latifolia]|uniref:uncharacterized protein n=1 Tax=Typha latifolia TaxID=4733 RepID=UPI003C2C4DAA